MIKKIHCYSKNSRISLSRIQGLTLDKTCLCTTCPSHNIKLKQFANTDTAHGSAIGLHVHNICICKQNSESALINPIALRIAKTLWSFGHSEC